MNRAEEILNDFLEDDQAEDAIVLSSTTYLSVKDVRTILNIYAKSQEGEWISIEKLKDWIMTAQVAAEQGECLMPNVTDILNEIERLKALIAKPKTKDNE